MSAVYREMCTLLEWKDDEGCLCGLGKMLWLAYNFRKYKKGKWYFSGPPEDCKIIRRLILRGVAVNSRAGEIPDNY
jgi:hypothetical protein